MKIESELLKEFSKCYSETEKNCGEIIAKYNEFQKNISVIENFVISNIIEEKAKNSLLYLRYLQMIIEARDLRFSLITGNYKTVVQITRYYFECLIQAFYIDQKHDAASLDCKIAVLSEIFDKSEYFVNRLINKTKLDNRLKKFYDELNEVVHPSHRDFPSVEEMIKILNSPEYKINAEEFSDAFEINKRMHGCSIYLIFKNFPELEQMVREEHTITKVLKTIGLPLSLGSQ